MMQAERGKNFRDDVFQIVRAIPRGAVCSYTEVAEQAGFPGAACAVGTLMRKNIDPSVPCHVI